MDLIKMRIKDFVSQKTERRFDPVITYNQLMSNRVFAMSWGIHDVNGHGDSALSFKVNGRLHKGYVIITLGFMDTYNIYLLDDNAEQVGEVCKGVYFDMLNETVDNLVETLR